MINVLYFISGREFKAPSFRCFQRPQILLDLCRGTVPKGSFTTRYCSCTSKNRKVLKMVFWTARCELPCLQEGPPSPPHQPDLLLPSWRRDLLLLQDTEHTPADWSHQADRQITRSNHHLNIWYLVLLLLLSIVCYKSMIYHFCSGVKCKWVFLYNQSDNKHRESISLMFCSSNYKKYNL